MIKHKVEQIRRRKQLRRKYLKQHAVNEPYLLGTIDHILDKNFPSCKMFINVEIQNNLLVIFAEPPLGGQVKDKLLTCIEVHIPKYFTIDAIIRRP